MNLSSTVHDLDVLLKTERYNRELLLSKYKDIYHIFRKDYHHNAALLLSLKIINMLVGKYERAKKKITIQNRPYGLIVDPSNGCTLHCPGCVHSLLQTYDWPNGLLSEETYSNFLIVYAPYACYAFLYNYGEPFLNPLTPALIKKSKNYLLDTWISSHLSIPRLDCKAIVESGLDNLIVSLDGVTQEVYSKFRRNGNIDLVFDNIRSLVNKKRKTGSNRPYIIWQYLVFEHNLHEIDIAKKIAREIGVDKLHFARPSVFYHDDPSIIIKEDFMDEFIYFNKHVSHINEDIMTLPENNELQLEFSLFDNLIPVKSGEENITRNKNECGFLYTTITMDAIGRILPCCAAPVNESTLLVFDRFSGNNYSFNNELFTDSRKNVFAFSGRECNGRKPYCYYCTYRGRGMFNTFERFRYYLLGVGNKNLVKCQNIILEKQPLIKMVLKAIAKKTENVSPRFTEYCKKIYYRFFRRS